MIYQKPWYTANSSRERVGTGLGRGKYFIKYSNSHVMNRSEGMESKKKTISLVAATVHHQLLTF